ncbi:hypothetical protein [Deinococcus peraridilitoris]|uniref:hypothetical protein n=1 Tax=Deinococcus peraridilitoris TaxID=432329 RepID=UPI0002E1076B|nr:hypothetical protein [Deinococcus peraridilitoris]
MLAIWISLSERATSVLAAVRRLTDIAARNAVGANIFNVLSILEITAPIQPIDVSPSLYRLEFPPVTRSGTNQKVVNVVHHLFHSELSEPRDSVRPARPPACGR